MTAPLIRPATDADSQGVIALIGGVFAEYPGCVLDLDGEMPELRAIATTSSAMGARIWVAEAGAAIVGCVGCRPAQHPPRMMELIRLYVSAHARGRGLGGSLTGLVERTAAAEGFGGVVLWSDTRFLDAHRLYEQRGYRRQPKTRALNDLSNSIEFEFHKTFA